VPLLAETLTVFFGLVLFAALVAFSRDPSRRNAILAGLVLGLATLNHPETYVAPPLLILWVVVAHPRRGIAAKRLALLLVIFGLTILPWHAYHALRNETNVFLPPGLDAGGVLAQATLDAKGRILGDPTYFEGTSATLHQEGRTLEKEHGMAGSVLRALRRVADDLKSHPDQYLEFVGLKLKRMWSLAPEAGPFAQPWVVIPTGALSALLYAGCLLGFSFHRPRGEVILALVLIAIYTLPHLVFYAQPRYRLPVMPVVILFGGVAAGTILDYFASRRPSFARPVTDHRRERG
jgi:4-amino-4-deoxy-L-arabinose transferase-like glycosyltransferase